MSVNKEYSCIPDSSRDQHLPMAPRYASPFRDQGIRGVGLHEVAPPYEIRRFNFPWHLALFTFQGEAEYSCLGKTGKIEAGQVWVGPFETAYSYAAKSEWKFVSAALYNTHQFAHLEGRVFHQDLSYSLEPVVYAIEAYLQESAATEGPGSEIPTGLATYISKAIVRDLQTAQGAGVNRNRLRLSQLWEEVNANPGNEWKLSILAQKMHVSVRQFQRLMQENYSLTAEGMMMRIRMEHARELLCATDLTIVMIAERVGYQCPFAFSKAFKRYSSLPPATYRRMSEKSEI
jgi:AraC-like DNA-binding protein